MLKNVARKISDNQDNYNIDNISDAVDLIHFKNKYFEVNKKEVLIVKIAKEMGFDIYSCNFDKNTFSAICISPDAKLKFGCDKIIMINTNIPAVYKRFALAFEIGNYLFNFKNSISNIEYYKYSTYDEIFSESLINKFASELLVPKKLFVKEYESMKSHGDIDYYEIASQMSKIFNVPIKIIFTLIYKYENI